jgi:hypothetical protein
MILTKLGPNRDRIELAKSSINPRVLAANLMAAELLKEEAKRSASPILRLYFGAAAEGQGLLHSSLTFNPSTCRNSLAFVVTTFHPDETAVAAQLRVNPSDFRCKRNDGYFRYELLDPKSPPRCAVRTRGKIHPFEQFRDSDCADGRFFVLRQARGWVGIAHPLGANEGNGIGD